MSWFQDVQENSGYGLGSYLLVVYPGNSVDSVKIGLVEIKIVEIKPGVRDESTVEMMCLGCPWSAFRWSVCSAAISNVSPAPLA